MKRTSKQPAASAIPASGYADWLQALSRRYRQSQIKAAIAVNSEMLRFYFSLGADIVRMEKDQPWGSGFLKRLSSDLRKAMPDANCFSENNLIYMRCFFELYSPFLPTPQVVGKSSVRIAPQPVGKIPVLLNFLDTKLHERQGKALTNFASRLPESESDLAQEVTKDPYSFDFIALTPRYREKELKDALLANVERFLLELGQGFMPVGVSEYRISDSLPSEIASDLPSIAEIESSLPAVSPAHRRKHKS